MARGGMALLARHFACWHFMSRITPSYTSALYARVCLCLFFLSRLLSLSSSLYDPFHAALSFLISYEPAGVNMQHAR